MLFWNSKLYSYISLGDSFLKFKILLTDGLSISLSGIISHGSSWLSRIFSNELLIMGDFKLKTIDYRDLILNLILVMRFKCKWSYSFITLRYPYFNISLKRGLKTFCNFQPHAFLKFKLPLSVGLSTSNKLNICQWPEWGSTYLSHK